MSPAQSTRALGAAALLALAASAPALAQQATTADLDRLLAVVEAQQAQIDALRAELDAMKATRTAATRPPAPAAAVASAPVPVAADPATAAPRDDDDRTEAQMVAEGFTWKDSAGRSLTLSGQVNPAFNVVDDGVSTDVFIVDNDTSGTRFRLDADAPLGDTSIGATLEIGASPNNSSDVSQLASQTDADFNVRRAEVTFRDDRYGRLQLGKGSSAADDTAEYDLSLVAGPIMYAGVADIAGGIIFTDGTELANLGTPDDPVYLTVGDAFFDFDGDRLGRVRYDSPMFGPVQGSVSYGQDDQWAAAVTLGGDYGDWSGWTVGNFTLLAAASVYNTEDDIVDYAYAGLRLGPARPDRPQPDVLHRRPEARRGRRPVEPLRQDRLGHRALVARPHRLRHRLHPGREHQRRRRRRHLLGHRGGAADRALQDRPLCPAPPLLGDGATDPDLEDITVGTFGTKFAF